MTLLRWILAAAILGGTFAAGFGAGVYTLPIIIASRGAADSPPPPAAAADDRRGVFVRDLPGSDPLHWGEGDLRIGGSKLVFEESVELAPGPDYRVYMTRRFVDDKPGFLAIKADSIEVGRLKTFQGPLTFDIPSEVDTDAYDNVLVWCEAFSMFITSARLD